MNEFASLCQAYKDYFTIGVSVKSEILDSHRDMLVKHFNSLTCENEMKQYHIHPEKDRYNFEGADKVANFARENHIPMRGHTLVWHQANPDWVFKGDDGRPVSREELLRRLKDHITTVMNRYKDVIYCWDVVNEGIEDVEEDCVLRQSPWRDLIGDDYIKLAFQYAHEAVPECMLVYNEFATHEYGGEKPNKEEQSFNYIKGLMEEGVPIQAYGLQGHWDLTTPTLDEVKRAIETFAKLDVPLQITELDLSLYDYRKNEPGFDAPPADRVKIQAERYEKLFEIFRNYRKEIMNVTFWCASDDVSWLRYWPVNGRKDWPLLFDDNHREKPEIFHRVTDF